jgi:hypothetical protein
MGMSRALYMSLSVLLLGAAAVAVQRPGFIWLAR